MLSLFRMCSERRRISAISLAQRVAMERCESVGSVVGFQASGPQIRDQCFFQSHFLVK